MNVAIYFAGTILKGHETNASRWMEEHFQILREKLAPEILQVLSPAIRSDDLSDQRSVFGRDMTQISMSDLVFVDARHRRGLGVGAEMMWAKILGKPVIVWAPPETHYHQTEAKILDQVIPHFIHPFVENLSDAVVASVEEGAEWILRFLKGEIHEIKDRQSIQEAMDYYRETQLPQDVPMHQPTTCHK